VCVPEDNPEKALGLEQVVNPPPSREQAKVEPASFAENVNEAEVAATVPEGPESMEVSGGMRSTLQVNEVAELAWPTPSVAFTAKVWDPWASPE